MPIKTILAYLPSVKTTETIMPTVAKIAGPRNAHVIGLHLSHETAYYSELAYELPQDVFDQLIQVGKQTAEATRKVFEEAARNSLLSYEWRNPEASYAFCDELIASECHGADLVVCGKPGDSDESAGPWRDFSETAIIEGGRPVLLVPATVPEAHIGRNVVIAWSNTRESARAVFDSLDLLRGATTIRVVTLIDDEANRGAAEASGHRLIAALSRHDLQARLDVSFAEEGDTGNSILSRLMDEGCDLLIMGGYSRSPLREMIFGGASRVILRDTWVPTLLSH